MSARPAVPSSEQLAAVSELAGSHGLGSTATDQLWRLLRLLATDKLAPTSVRAPGRILEDHLADSLIALELDLVTAARQIVDIGSGAGLPGLPLAIALPKAFVTALESSSRKAAFIARAIEASGIDNARVVQARAESWSEGRGLADLITTRALAPLAVVSEYAAPLLSMGGALVAWTGRRDGVAESDLAAVAPVLGMELAQVRAVSPYPTAEHRHLHVLIKTAATPSRFPRRPGIARQRPLSRTDRPSD